MKGIILQIGAALSALALVSCSNEMRDQPYLEPLEKSSLFEDGMGSRPDVAGTVSREEGRYPAEALSGRKDGAFVEESPIPLTPESLRRGREVYEIYCIPCHGKWGKGDGLVTHHGLPRPPAFGQERLNRASEGHLFDVITNGYGVMFSYGERIDPLDRWAVVAYVRALQRAESLATQEKEAGQ